MPTFDIHAISSRVSAFLSHLGLSWAVVHPALNKINAAHWISLNLQKFKKKGVIQNPKICHVEQTMHDREKGDGDKREIYFRLVPNVVC